MPRGTNRGHLCLIFFPSRMSRMLRRQLQEVPSPKFCQTGYSGAAPQGKDYPTMKAAESPPSPVSRCMEMAR
ncbi:unnamed protein product [Gulo gulo]|uniref:Uncharacterized protein n=1 Tax=Gulo gulo TaxID=48420 RepID=A0A9X9PVD3_GULGU|nr:unnamed protein product [Gulo gulo]